MREMLSETNWQYLTGSLEAGSSIWLSKMQVRRQTKTEGKTYTSCSTTLKVTRDERELLEILQPFFLQPIHDRYLQIQGERALPLLEGIYPYTRVLKPLVRVAIDFENSKQELKESGRKVYDLSEQYYQKMRQCKRYLSAFYIGKEALSAAYLAGFWDQDRVSITTTTRETGWFLCEFSTKNVSFLELLKEQFGGHLYPKSKQPKIWRATGREARAFFEFSSPFMRRLDYQQAKLGIRLENPPLGHAI